LLNLTRIISKYIFTLFRIIDVSLLSPNSNEKSKKSEGQLSMKLTEVYNQAFSCLCLSGIIFCHMIFIKTLTKISYD